MFGVTGPWMYLDKISSIQPSNLHHQFQVSWSKRPVAYPINHVSRAYIDHQNPAPLEKPKDDHYFKIPGSIGSPPLAFYCQDSEFSLKRWRKARGERKQSSLSTPKAQIKIFPISTSLLAIFLAFSPIFFHFFFSALSNPISESEIKISDLSS